MLACKKRLDMRTVWYISGDKRIRLETPLQNLLQPVISAIIPANSQLPFPQLDLQSVSIIEQTSQPKPKRFVFFPQSEISKHVKKAKLLNTKSFCDI